MRLATTSIVFWMIFLLVRAAVAQQPVLSGQRSPLQFPVMYDQVTVQQELDHIDQEHNATLLKIGYFMRGGSASLPLAQGQKMLRDSLTHERPSSDRWFMLQEVRAFAGLRGRMGSVDEGLTAYQEIFNHASEASDPKSHYAVLVSLSEFIFSVPGKLTDAGEQASPRTRQLLAQAWKVYLSIWNTGNDDGLPDIDWGRAIRAAGATAEFTTLVDQALHTNTPPSLGVIRAVVSVYGQGNVAKTLAVLKQNEVVVGNRTQDVFWYYSTLSDLQQKSGDPKAALNSVSLLVQRTQEGYDRLLPLAISLQDHSKINAAITELIKPEAKEGEILLAAQALSDQTQEGSKAPEQALTLAIKILDQYLSGDRERRLPVSLRARLLLATDLKRVGRVDDAFKASLLPEVPADLLDPESCLFLQNIHRFHEALSTDKVK